MMPERYAELFRDESREHLATANDALLVLERGDDAARAIAELFRAVHSLKGMSAAMGYAAVAELAHACESLLSRLREEAIAVTPDVMDALFAAADALDEAVEAAIAGRDGAVDCSAVLQRLQSLAGESGDRTSGAAPDATREERREAMPGTPGAAAPAAAASDGSGGLEVRVGLDPQAPLAGARAVLVVRRAEALGQVTDLEPPLAALQAGEATAFRFHVRSAASPDEIERAIRSAGDVVSLEIAPATEPDAARPSGPVAGRAAAPRSVRVEARRLDALLDLAGELVIARGRLADAAAPHAADPQLRDALAHLSRLVGAMQDEVLSSRLVPVAQLFDRFPRLVRDTARLLGKEVVLELEGKDVHLDRSLLDEVGDPLVHLLRNALDHGVELPAEREAAGKPRAGRLVLSAARDRDTVLVRVADDGRGIDRARVRRRARELGLLDDDRPLTDAEIVRLVARAGFSTAERVTDVSGRGVGVDAVQTRMRALGGAVEIDSREGVGTTVTLRLPLTLAITRTVLARVGDEVYALPAGHVAATGELDAIPATTVRGEPVLLVADQPLPALDLRAVVGLPPSAAAGRELVVVESGERRVALVVDELLGQQDAVVKRFDRVRGALDCFSGATILGNGTPALIVDVGRLLTQGQS
ncbi:MAG TPA: chemotaxis protein CheA [Gemmatimonadaceae bacterium]|nr:chemotaxis protein CheA [Gemmatimonadaceae bacterium]